MRLIGLTGGIASGKSTASGFFRALGASVVDADQLSREVVAPGSEGFDAIVQTWGRSIIGSDGSIDRKRLGDIIFADEAERKKLEAITHPRIFARFGERSAEAAARHEPALIYDAPLLIERGLHLGMHDTIVVWVPRAVQVQRLMERDLLTREAAEMRLAAQMPLDEKRALATYVIDNSGSLTNTEAQVAFIWRDILRKSAQ